MTRTMIVIAAALGLIAAGPVRAQEEETVTYTWNGFPLAIYPDDADVVSAVQILVPRALDITKVVVGMQINFERVGDLTINTYSAEGDEVRILSEDCGELMNIDTTFDDDAESGYSDFCPVEAGRGPFRPRGELSDYKDENSFGVWTLAVENTRSSRNGWITGFSVTITGTPTVGPVLSSNTVRNAAGYNYPGSLAPGEIISIFGAGVGPAESVTADPGTLPTTLGGTTVTLNGSSIPLSYVSQLRVDAVVPANYAGGPLKVTREGLSSDDIQVTRFFARPAVYTTDALGKGQIKAANQDGTLNSADSPAAKGSIVTFWATGLGPVTPAIGDGEAAPDSPLSYTDSEVAAAIGGVQCEVLYAGLAPGFTGVYQINVMVDPSVPSGTQELSISTANSSSQPDVTIEIQ